MKARKRKKRTTNKLIIFLTLIYFVSIFAIYGIRSQADGDQLNIPKFLLIIMIHYGQLQPKILMKTLI